jgi:hypothetical protein
MKHQFVIGACASLLAMACEERIIQPVIITLKQPRTDGGCTTGAPSAAPTVPPSKCEGRCCPTFPACYPSGNPSLYSGAECLAARDNTNESRWQLRQTMSVSLKPVGLAASAVASLLVHRSELTSEKCGAPLGTGGFMQLTDFDTAAGISRTGFAKYDPSLTSAVAAKLCFVQEDLFESPGYALRELYAPPAGWPNGLPSPMPMPWKVVPVTAAKLDSDFTLPGDRPRLLALLAEGGDLFGKFNGVFYFDKAKGTMHGYSPVTYIVNYDSPTQHVVIPIREAELTQRFNDPAHPNCVGSLLGDISAADCVGDGTNLAWGCPAGNCASGELAPTKIHGYFLIAELEQIFTAGQTLCNLFASGMYPNWTIPASDLSCRRDSKWNPLDPVRGIPTGDWCATTNEAAQGDCHDALESLSYATFQAFPIQDGTCSPL